FEMCQEVALISYSNPEFPGCEAEKRESWLVKLFPQARRVVVAEQQFRQCFSHIRECPSMPTNDADGSLHRRFTGFLCLNALGVTVDAVFTSEEYGDGFARDLTSYFRQYLPASPEVRHVLVDAERKAMPVSGTLIRADIETHREWLSPV